ncbi:hypothetical protein SEA_GIANTSBANE_5 [Arthrobacter phage Giantsbane]|nr:hypothetical protein SEA_GIANTSBANE_5 [Arthrobacter phage Giantsbane]
MVNDSILDSTKKLLGFESDYTAFDLDIILHINTVFFTLTQLGIGPETGFSIEDKEAKWADFIGAENLQAVKSYMGLRVRLLFDPPSSSFALESFNKQAEQLEWRLHVHMEGVRYPLVTLTEETLTSS